MSIDAVSASTITANVLAGSASISGGGVAAVGLSGAGVSTENKVRTKVRAYIDGDDNDDADMQKGITAGTVALNASDTSSVTADAKAASLAAAFAGKAAVAISVGVGLADNEIDNVVESYIRRASTKVESEVGAVSIKATGHATINATAAAAAAAVGGGLVGIALSGAGAEATNVILGEIKAYADNNSLVQSKTDVTVEAKNTSTIEADIVSAAASLGAGAVGAAFSIGASVAENFIGFDSDGNKKPLVVRASLDESSVTAAGDVNVTAMTMETISALTAAASVSVAIGAVRRGRIGFRRQHDEHDRQSSRSGDQRNGYGRAPILSRSLRKTSRPLLPRQWRLLSPLRSRLLAVEPWRSLRPWRKT